MDNCKRDVNLDDSEMPVNQTIDTGQIKPTSAPAKPDMGRQIKFSHL